MPLLAISSNSFDLTARIHYIDVIMTTMASQITSLAVVYSTVYSDADQRKHQSSASLAFVWGIHRDRWIPRTKCQLRGKCFHLMTSSWNNHNHMNYEILLIHASAWKAGWAELMYQSTHGPLTRYAKLPVAHAPGMPGTFSPTPRVSDPDMHRGTCMTLVPWCMPGWLTSGFVWGR